MLNIVSLLIAVEPLAGLFGVLVSAAGARSLYKIGLLKGGLIGLISILTYFAVSAWSTSLIASSDLTSYKTVTLLTSLLPIYASALGVIGAGLLGAHVFKVSLLNAVSASLVSLAAYFVVRHIILAVAFTNLVVTPGTMLGE